MVQVLLTLDQIKLLAVKFILERLSLEQPLHQGKVT